MRVVLRVAFVVSLATSALLACGGLVGIEDLGVAESTAGDGAVPPAPDARDEPPPDAREAEVDASSVDAGTKTVFVTSDRSNGAMDGLAGADQRCSTAAARGGLDAGFVAWLSSSTANAIDRIDHPGAYRLLDGRVVVKNKAQLAGGSLDEAIDVNESNVRITGDKLVWTGTFPTGQRSATCSDWTSNGAIIYGTAGSLDRPKLGDWTDNGGPGFDFETWGCQTSARLYCFER